MLPCTEGTNDMHDTVTFIYADKEHKYGASDDTPVPQLLILQLA